LHPDRPALSPNGRAPAGSTVAGVTVATPTAEARAEFVLQFDPSEIEPLAARFGDTDDSVVDAAGADARARGFYTAVELVLVCAWKSPRSGPLVAENAPGEIEAATRRALAAGATERERVDALTALRGVGVPSASTLLYFAFPTGYPILDVRALESLGANGRSTYSAAFWERYLAACRALASEHGVSIRTLDKALWQYSKERSAQSLSRGSARPIGGDRRRVSAHT
jgi:hypothetical protein